MTRGSLIVAGTGIKVLGHVTLETRTLIERAETLLYMVADPATGAWIRELNPRAESLEPYFGEGRTRWDAFQLIIERILSEVRRGADVCAVFYGHPGVFVYMSHEAIRRARAEGFDASMLPGISAEDCLIADLGVDTAAIGYQCLEASYFLIQRRRPDTASALILWQIGVIGQFHAEFTGTSTEGLSILTGVLLEHYPAQHPVTVYEAAIFPVCEPLIRTVALAELPRVPVSRISTLYVPPAIAPASDPHMMQRLGMVTPVDNPGSSQ
jgi:uncharacterized protein YabN with tetrapyrrole methylase and pyrophosphatase domain